MNHYGVTSADTVTKHCYLHHFIPPHHMYLPPRIHLLSVSATDEVPRHTTATVADMVINNTIQTAILPER